MSGFQRTGTRLAAFGFTLLLATGSPVLLYAVLALAGLACLPLSAMRAHVPAVPR